MVTGGALAGLAGALYARASPAAEWVARGAVVWGMSVGLASGMAARRVARLWHLPLAAAAALVGLGLAVQTRLAPAAGARQAGLAAVGSGLAVLLWHTRGGPWGRGRGWDALLALAAVGVVLTLRWGVHPAGLAGRLWLPVGPWHLPPGEVLKTAWVGVVARRARPRAGLPASTWALAFGLAGLLVVQGDWGSAALMVLIALSVHAGQADRWRAWWLAAGLLAALTPVLLQIPRVRQRWDAWLWPQREALGYGYQPLAAEQALRRGGWWGTGFGAGQPEQVPLSLTDFIFVAWGEEMGWFGLVVLVALEAVVWLGLGCRVCRLPPGWPQRLGMAVTAYGAHLTAWVMAGNLRLVPLSGLPLPWVAHGGAALLSLTVLLAVLTTQRPAQTPAPCPRAWQGMLRVWAGVYGLVLLRAAWLVMTG